MPTLYKPVKSERFFNKNRRYDAIKWNDEKEVIREFRQQLIDWYVEPGLALEAKESAEFALLALTCMLIDTLAQYEAGAASSSQTCFKNWLVNTPTFSHYSNNFPVPIRETSAATSAVAAANFSDAIYRAFRCGILHEAHVTLYGGIWGCKDEIEYHPKGETLYVDGADCPSVVVDPRKLFRKVMIEFEDYFNRLLNDDPLHQPLRDRFKQKFLSSYGIDIGNEP
jgi:hypothetical protein